jgi:putative hydrolase of the HAD superfamily
MTLRAVFLDLGNTLLRESPSRAEIYAESARARGVEVGAERMRELMARAHHELPRELGRAFRYSDAWFREFQRRIFQVELGIAPGAFEELSDELFARFEDPRTFVLYPGARELLDELGRRGLVRGLISNWSERLPKLLRALGLQQDFELVLCSARERLEKPDPELFRTALQRAGVPAESALHAGDHVERDVQGALAAGLQAVLVDHEGRVALPASPPCTKVESLAQLLDYVLERAA